MSGPVVLSPREDEYVDYPVPRDLFQVLHISTQIVGLEQLVSMLVSTYQRKPRPIHTTDAFDFPRVALWSRSRADAFDRCGFGMFITSISI